MSEGVAFRGKILQRRTIEGKKIWILEGGWISRDTHLTVSMKNCRSWSMRIRSVQQETRPTVEANKCPSNQDRWR